VGDAQVQYYQLDYTKFVPLIISAVKDIALIGGTFKANLIAWFADATNGIGDLFAGTVHAQNELCVGSTCVDEAQFKAMVEHSAAEVAGGTASPDGTPAQGDANPGTGATDTSTSTTTASADTSASTTTVSVDTGAATTTDASTSTDSAQ
jgi:hypothetical protein